ncbi:MAG: glycosyltransferase family 2 protein [Desulfobacteraceae bacterium]|nr:glycosyltransferase family 2 protein [Desulfobacteraceae bacterium]
MSLDKPLVSIGMTAYNGEEYIAQTLESLLAQDYTDFELLICDDASTDCTCEIILAYAQKDSRIHFHRNQKNIGQVSAWNQVARLASGKYFKWASDHDCYDPRFISKCLEVFTSDPEIVLVYSLTQLIDMDETPLGIMYDRFDTRRLKVIPRYKILAREIGVCNMMYGLIRREVLMKTPLFRNMIGPDNLIVTELSLYGTFAQIQEPLYIRRQNRSFESLEQMRERHLRVLCPERAEEMIHWPHSRLFREIGNEYLKAVITCPAISLTEKIHATLITLSYFRRFHGTWWFGLSHIESLLLRFWQLTRQTS